MTAGADGETIDGFNLTWISEIIDDIKKRNTNQHPLEENTFPKRW